MLLVKKTNGQTQERSEKITAKGMDKSILQFEDYTDKINLDYKKIHVSVSNDEFGGRYKRVERAF